MNSLGQYDYRKIHDYDEDKIKYRLFIFSTNWFKKKTNKNTDINKYDYYEFSYMIDRYITEYEANTEKSKYDVVYSDNMIDVLIPMNFSASYETAKNTQWCSQSLNGYSMWNEMSIMFRIIPKDKSYDKLKLTWMKEENNWNMACFKYPEIHGKGNPFRKSESEEAWLKYGNKQLVPKYDNLLQIIIKTMSIVSNEAKKEIVKKYNMIIKNKNNV